MKEGKTMGLFNRAKEGKTETPEQLIKATGVSYLQFVSQERHSKINPIKLEIKELEDAISETLDVIGKEQKVGNSAGRLCANIAALRERLADKEKELSEAEVANNVDFELLNLAQILDRLEGTNKGIDLYYVMVGKVQQVYDLLKEIEGCYGGSYYAPSSVSMTKEILGRSIIPNINADLKMLKKEDKVVLEGKIMNRLKIINDKRQKSDIHLDKYKGLLKA